MAASGKRDTERDLMLLLLGYYLGQEDRSGASEILGGTDAALCDLAEDIATGEAAGVWGRCRQLWGLDRSKSRLIDAVRTRFSEIVRIRKVRSVSGKIEMAAAVGDFAKVRERTLEAYQQCDGGAGIGQERSA